MECQKLLLQIIAAIYYSGALLAAQFSNKAIFTVYNFKYPISLALLQMIIMCPVYYVISRPKMKLNMLYSFLPLAAVNAINLVSGLIAMAAINIPMFIVLRQFTLLFTLFIERYIYSKKHSKLTYIMVTPMIFGATLAAITDKTFNTTGYIAIIVNNCCTALYLLLIRKTKEFKDLKSINVSFYTSLLTIPFLLFGTLFSGEILNFHVNENWNIVTFKLIFFSSCVLGIISHHSQVFCSRINSPMITAISGQNKNIVATIAGTFAFHDYIFSVINTIALLISNVGGLCYAVAIVSTSSQTLKQDILPIKTIGLSNGKLKNYANLKLDMPSKQQTLQPSSLSMATTTTTTTMTSNCN